VLQLPEREWLALVQRAASTTAPPNLPACDVAIFVVFPAADQGRERAPSQPAANGFEVSNRGG